MLLEDPRIWRASRGLGVEPCRAFFVDDRLQNIEGTGRPDVHYVGAEAAATRAIGAARREFPEDEQLVIEASRGWHKS
jgi:hypothetical protein